MLRMWHFFNGFADQETLHLFYHAMYFLAMRKYSLCRILQPRCLADAAVYRQRNCHESMSQCVFGPKAQRSKKPRPPKSLEPHQAISP